MDGVTRRLAAILAADVAGYSRLVGIDEEGTIAAFRDHKLALIDPMVAQYGGRIANTAGDSFLVEFPSVVEALRCALEIQEGLAKRNEGLAKDRLIQLRIGINLGDVIDEDGDLLGDGVNVAARLEALAEPGGILISRAARDQVRDRIDLPLVDMGEINAKNIARPIRIFRVGIGPGPKFPSQVLRRLGGPKRRRSVVAIGLCALALVGAASVGTWFVMGSNAPVQGRSALSAGTSLAVLPFSNLNRNPDQNYFADGITSDLITDLSKFQNLFVIASNSAFAYRDKTEDLKKAGRELGVQYVLKGSVQKHKDRVRINAQLFEVDSGKLVWGERYEDSASNLFEIQDKLTRNITRTLSVKLTTLELDRALSKNTADLQAYDLVLRGKRLLATVNRTDNFEARRLFRRAIKRDSKYGAALTGLGKAYYDAVLFGWTETPQKALKRAEALALKAIEVHANSVDGHNLLAAVYLIRRQHSVALVESERAIAINPNNAESHAVQGAILLWSGRPKGAIRALEIARRFDPLMGSLRLTHLATAYYLTGRYQKAIGILKRAIGLSPNFAHAHTILAAAYGQLGRKAEARRAGQAIRKFDPFFSTKRFGRLFLKPSDAQSIIEGLHKAGVE